MSLGPVMLDVEGFRLSDADRKRLQHAQVGGVILFSRNYESPAQLRALCDEIRALRSPQLVIAVDQEGGRVQRFREHFEELPAMGQLGMLYDSDQGEAIRLAESFAWIMASELLHYGVDLSFAPVLDIADPVSSVIGDRAFHRDTTAITRLANAWIRGMKKAGMEAVGKHFPGHGSVSGDSHHVVIATHLTGIMMAHVIYDQVDPQAAGYSRYWIETVLRGQLQFDGIVFSDDLSMSGAESVGGYAERARQALAAGCDILLVCNNPAGADEVLASLKGYANPTSQLRMIRLHARPAAGLSDLYNTQQWQQAVKQLQQFKRQQGLSDSGDLFE